MNTRRTTEAKVLQAMAPRTGPADPQTPQQATRKRVRHAARPMPRRTSRAFAGLAAGAAVLLATPGVALATSCEQVMAPIEARIRAKGVTDFRLEAVDQAASAPGQPVGTCDLGRKKILYVRGAASAAGAARPAAAPAGERASAPRVITECADGRVIEQGSCKKK